jgi:hypothetical protein
MAEDWTLTHIIASVRKFSGRLSANDMSTTDVTQYINRFYCNELPFILSVREFNEWHAFNLVIGDYEYLLNSTEMDSVSISGEDLAFIGRPLLLDGDEIPLTLDVKSFYDRWPQSATYDNTTPTEALLDGGKLVIMGPPDDTYEVKFPIRRYKPTALADSGGYPLNKRWGKLIAAGAPKLIMEEIEEDITNVVNVIKEQVILFTRETMQQICQERSKGRY